MGWHDDRAEKPTGEIIFHADWQANRQYSVDFLQKQVLEKGVNAYFGDAGSPICGTIKKGILFLSWMPPATAHKGNYATPIFLHQPRYDFRNQFHAGYEWVSKLSQDFHKGIKNQVKHVDQYFDMG
jgi:hypothetical protein